MNVHVLISLKKGDEACYIITRPLRTKMKVVPSRITQFGYIVQCAMKDNQIPAMFASMVDSKGKEYPPISKRN
jgi:hypothetical protein